MCSIVGNYIAIGSYTSLDKYGNIKCVEATWPFSFYRTCNKNIIQMESNVNRKYSGLLNEDSRGIYVGQDGDYKNIKIEAKKDCFIYSFSSYNSQKKVHYNGFLKLENVKNKIPCNCATAIGVVCNCKK